MKQFARTVKYDLRKVILMHGDAKASRTKTKIYGGLVRSHRHQTREKEREKDRKGMQISVSMLSW